LNAHKGPNWGVWLGTYYNEFITEHNTITLSAEIHRSSVKKENKEIAILQNMHFSRPTRIYKNT